MKRLVIFFLFSVSIELFFATDLEALQESQYLTKEDIQNVMENIFSQHMDKKTMSEEIVKDSFVVFINQFDPKRKYLLEEEVEPYLHLNFYKVQKILQDYRNNQFSSYVDLNQLFQNSIRRAREIRKEEIKKMETNEKQSSSVFEEETISLSFPNNKKELRDRIVQDLLSFIASMKMRYTPSFVEDRKVQFLQQYDEAIKKRENNYLYEKREGQKITKVEEENLFVLHLLKALAKSLDKNTKFLSKEEFENFRIDLEKEYSGIGLVFERRGDNIFVKEILDGSPAQESRQIEKGDQLIMVGGRKIDSENWQKEIENLRGPTGTSVTLTFLDSDQKEKKVGLTRKAISLQGKELISAYEKFGNGIIGKITLNSFYLGEHGSSSSQDVKKAIQELKKIAPLKGLIIDLRNNLGGFLLEAVRIAGLFISNGVIVIAKERDGKEKIYRDIDPDIAFNGPVIVLTSHETASAGEIVAQSLQDYGVAIVVGEKNTFGKGTIQSQTIGSNDILSLFSVTVGKYYTVSGRTPEGQGVNVDIVLPSLESVSEKGKEKIKTSEKIPPQYIDSLSDVPIDARQWYIDYYIPTLQNKRTTWNSHLSKLKKNSDYRISKDKNYQAYLKGHEIEKNEDELQEEESEPIVNDYGEEDLMMIEAVNILKDMILIETNIQRQQAA